LNSEMLALSYPGPAIWERGPPINANTAEPEMT
jgi:hypothetical protein